LYCPFAQFAFAQLECLALRIVLDPQIPEVGRLPFEGVALRIVLDPQISEVGRLPFEGVALRIERAQRPQPAPEPFQGRHVPSDSRGRMPVLATARLAMPIRWGSSARSTSNTSAWSHQS
jgi:hypothetical protein